MGRVPIAGGEVVELERFSESEWAISPDGSRIAYVRRDEGNTGNHLAVMRMDSPTPEMILESSPIYVVKWRPDGNALLVRERDDGENPFATIVEHDLITRRKRVFLSAAPDYVIDISFSADNKRVAVVRGRLSTDAVILTTVRN